MELNRNIRDDFRQAGQTRTARLVVATNLLRKYTREEVENHIIYITNYLKDSYKIGSNLLLLGTAVKYEGCYYIIARSGATALLTPERFFEIADETADLALNILASAPFGELIKVDGSPKSKTNIAVGKDIMDSIVNLKNWVQNDDYEDYSDVEDTLQEQISHLGIITIKLGALTQNKFFEIIDWI